MHQQSNNSKTDIHTHSHTRTHTHTHAHTQHEQGRTQTTTMPMRWASHTSKNIGSGGAWSWVDDAYACIHVWIIPIHFTDRHTQQSHIYDNLTHYNYTSITRIDGYTPPPHTHTHQSHTHQSHTKCIDRYNVDVHIVNDFTFLFNDEQYSGNGVVARNGDGMME
jgi:hypothetical protein